MERRFHPISFRNFLRSWPTLLLIILGFSSAIVIGGHSPHGHALEREPEQVAVRNQWQGASFPVENFQAYTSPFGYRRSPTGGSAREFHRGLDMAAPKGSYVRNWWTGYVLTMSDNTACGTSIVIQSGSWKHTYCHLSGHVQTINGRRHLIDRQGGLQIQQGQSVPAGFRIGRVGMTGRTTGPHLHWGLKYDNRDVDPALVLRAMYAEQNRRQLSSSLPTKAP